MPTRTALRTRSASVGRIANRRQVVIPQVVLDALHLREGDLVEITAPVLEQGNTRPWSEVKREMGL